MITIKSKGIRKNPFLELLLNNYFSSDFNKDTIKCAVWGIEKSEVNILAEKEAKQKGIPILRLEDGIYRSYALEETSYSLYQSEVGIYYNAKEPSNLENILNSDWVPNNNDLENFRLCQQMIEKYNISKYNDAPDMPSYYLIRNHKKNILLIDQTYGDKSIEYGLASNEDFSLMLKEAIKKSDKYNVYVKMHPEVFVGKKQGYLKQEIDNLSPEERKKIILIQENYNAPSVIKEMDEVHVVTSQVGFDALLRNKQVCCYGVPFYSNWGITNDVKKIERRNKSRSVEDLFIALAFKLTNYINPFSGQRGDLLDLLEYISLQKRHKNYEEIVFYKTKLWKKTILDKFFKIKKSKYIFNENKLKLVKEKKQKLATWGFSKEKEILDNFICIEDGFIRSVGLGSDIEMPISLVADEGGIYFNPKKESDLEKILNYEYFTDYEKLIANEVINRILALKLTKYNVGQHTNIKEIKKSYPNKKIILVPGQVEDDASIAYGAVNIKTNFDLLKIVSEKRVGDVIVYKPHPDVLSGNRKSNQSPEEIIKELKKSFPDNIYWIEKGSNIVDCFDIADEVHVITSTSGLEAILRDKKVYTYGLPFYGGYGLTEDFEKYPRHRKKLTKEELMLGCYVLYPRYFLPGNNHYMNALSAIKYLSAKANKKIITKKNILNQAKRKVRLCIKTIQALI